MRLRWWRGEMTLEKIQIENFRSIKSQTIIIDHNCLILLGKNEAGKSNILKAIAAVFGKYKVTDKDKRKRIANETINNYYIYAQIKLSEADFNEILDRFIKKYSNTEYILFKDKRTLRNFIETVFYDFLIWIDIAENKNIYFSHWNFQKADFELENEVYLNGTTFNIEKQGVKQGTENIVKYVFDIIEKLYNENPYSCYYWQYSDSLLLPSSINISDFIVSPEKYRILKNIFIACNRNDIKKEFNDAISQDGDYSNLLDQTSKLITKIFRGIWKDFNDTSIELMAGGSEMIIKVTNKSKYSFEDRSDGFKKFISILLMLSTQARSKQIGERDIILIDEPDQSLYPSSAEYLRNELINISKTAKVIYATHSLYMIDSDCIERHLVIEKNDDITVINRQNVNSPYCNNELLRRAVGSSIFEIIKPKNIIFEGWLDKELFNKYCDYYENSIDIKQVGVVYLGGISGVETLVQLLILANKKFIIVADSDTVSESKRKDFEEHYEEYLSSWLSYADVAKEIMTMEDFISIKLLEEILMKNYPAFVYDASKKAIENIEKAVNNDKEKRQQIKKEVVKRVSKKDINKEYSTFIDKLSHKIEEL